MFLNQLTAFIGIASFDLCIIFFFTFGLVSWVAVIDSSYLLQTGGKAFLVECV